mmetsp:Transcript_29786/g.89618  ORF Transcript_29786/g.89618 Transcript_29786/m.89618 type:complete len:309 (-) Transcript_29786:20-946(-)
MKLARLVACAAVARARLVASAAVARSFAQTAADGGELNYLRIAKSGSMSILAALEAANKTTACHGLRSHYHETIARDLPPGSASFAVLRDPCERFVSVFDHLRFKLTGRPGGPELTHDAVTWARALRDDPKERRRWLNVGARGIGHYVEAARRRVVAACVAPMGIAETRRRRGNCEDASWPRGSRRRVAAAGIASTRRSTVRRAQVVPWPQTAYVGNDTMTACLPTLRADVQGILDRVLPGCVLPPVATLNRVKRRPSDRRRPGARRRRTSAKHAHTVKPSPELCSVVNEVYADDARLWRSRCGESRA